MNLWQFSFLLLIGSSLQATPFTNGGFEAGLDGWRFWTRDRDAGTVTLERQVRHEGNQSARIEHRGEQDWSFEPGERVSVQPGELFELEVWVRAEGESSITLCASTWNKDGKAIEWSYVERAAQSGRQWQLLRTRLLVPDGIVQIQPRLIGYGKTMAWVDDFALRKATSHSLARNPNLPAVFTLTNQLLTVSLTTSNAALTVRDRRNGRVWGQKPQNAGLLVTDAVAKGNQLELTLFHAPSGLEVKGTLALSPDQPELTFELAAAGELHSPLRFPHPFDTAAGDYLVIPMNEGISYPVEDETVPLHRLIAYGGHGICMAFWGVTDGEAGQMAIIETPDDAAIQTRRLDHRLVVAPEWDPQRQAFGYARKLRYVFFDRGGHVAMAKRYRAYAKQIGLLKTLEEKRRANPNIDLLVGAVNVWCWDRDAVALVKEMQAGGIERILWSNAQSPENLRALNDLGVLTSRYDIYQDVMDPAQFPKLRWQHADWTTAAWPNDLMIEAGGQWTKGWGVEAKDGTMIHCGVLCDKRALDYARERVPADLATHPYKCRFIDTTTASPWRECYATNHPMTRTESKQAKMQLLRYISGDARQVTGCETGHDAAVPYVDYFEGMLSLGPYRVPDSGRRMNVLWTNVPEVVAKYQLGHTYRLPLWELVFHDCTIAQWYWGDYNNKLPALWDKRDLFNVLYGTPPMFMFERKLWSEQKARFIQSYRNTCPYVRQTGYSEMLDHRFLTPDRSVQQTTFANGQTVTVNFGSAPYLLPNGNKLDPIGFVVAPR
jgi:Glycosyl hydrolases related to GH101 family, GH129/Carbohydrate binding domain